MGGHQRYGLVLQDKPKGMIRRNRRGRFTRQRVASRWERIMLLSMLGGILLGIGIDYVFYEKSHYVYAKEEVQEVVVEPQIVQIRPAWTPDYIEKRIKETFPEDPETALKVAKCESGLRVDAIGPTQDHGLFQVHTPSWDKVAHRLGYDNYKDDLEDNLSMARYIYDGAGKRWTDWVCYTRGMI